jgi:hypothetical protein
MSGHELIDAEIRRAHLIITSSGAGFGEWRTNFGLSSPASFPPIQRAFFLASVERHPSAAEKGAGGDRA